MAKLKDEAIRGVKLHFRRMWVGSGTNRRVNSYVEGNWDGDGTYSERSATGMTKHAVQSKLVSKLRMMYPKTFRTKR